MRIMRTALGLSCLAVAAHGCTADRPTESAAATELGSARVNLVLSDGREITNVDWQITGGDSSSR